MATPYEKIDLLKAKFSRLRPNVLARLISQDSAATDLQPSLPLAGAPRVASGSGKVEESLATERFSGLENFAAARAQNPTPIRSLISSLFSKPTLSESELEAVRLAERQRARDELVQAEQLQREREAEAEKKKLERPILL